MITANRMQHVSSGGLALLVHGMLLLGLMVGVSWKNPPHLPVEAEIWVDLPLPPAAIEAPPTVAQYAPVPEPLPARETEPVLADQAEIALEKAEKKRAEDQRLAQEREAEARRLKEKALAEKAVSEKKLAEAKLAEDKRAEEVRRAERQRVEDQRLEHERAEKEKREQSRQLIDQEVARQMREELAAENVQLRAMQNVARLNQQARVVQDFQDRIRNKIKDALVLPRNLKGDAEVTLQVSLLPNGEVMRVTLVKTSGQPLYDGAVERAIFKASPLPLPSERELAAKFRDGLILKFRPSEDAAELH